MVFSSKDGQVFLLKMLKYAEAPALKHAGIENLLPPEHQKPFSDGCSTVPLLPLLNELNLQLYPPLKIQSC